MVAGVGRVVCGSDDMDEVVESSDTLRTALGRGSNREVLEVGDAIAVGVCGGESCVELTRGVEAFRPPGP